MLESVCKNLLGYKNVRQVDLSYLSIASVKLPKIRKTLLRRKPLDSVRSLMQIDELHNKGHDIMITFDDQMVYGENASDFSDIFENLHWIVYEGGMSMYTRYGIMTKDVNEVYFVKFRVYTWEEDIGDFRLFNLDGEKGLGINTFHNTYFGYIDCWNEEKKRTLFSTAPLMFHLIKMTIMLRTEKYLCLIQLMLISCLCVLYSCERIDDRLGPIIYLSEIEGNTFDIENSYLVVYKKNSGFNDSIIHRQLYYNAYEDRNLKLDFGVRIEKRLKGSFLPYYDYRIVLEDTIYFDITDITMAFDTVAKETFKEMWNALVSFKSNGTVVKSTQLIVPYSTRVIKNKSNISD